jgi:parallel beta-helix repeat protein
MKKILAAVIIMATILNACKKDDKNNTGKKTKYTFATAAYSESSVQEAMIEMNNGDTIYFTQGTYNFTSTLSIDGKDSIVITGDGRTNTTLSFSNQTTGAQGILGTNLKFVLFKDFTVLDANGDGIKIKDSDGVTFLRVGAVYSSPADSTNGAYGLYPVTSHNILIDDCYVSGASDAGIYVGQSQQVIVRNSLVEGNVAGMEIENCINSDVYGNTARNNTGGIMVFDLPTLPVIKNGNTCRVFNNIVENNSLKNFAQQGNMVANIPVGTGIMILAGEKVEVFNNTLTNNNVMGIGIISYNTLSTLDASLVVNDPGYVPFCKQINIHNNMITSSSTYPAEMNEMSNLLTGLVFSGGDVPDILYDGFVHPDASGDATKSICIKNNGSATFSNMDVANFFAGLTLDGTAHDCSQAALPVVTVVAPAN